MKHILIIIILIAICCSRTEPITFGEYYVLNQTNEKIYLEAECDFCGTQNKVILFLQNEVANGEKVHILSVREGTGGHVMPSNFFSRFTIYSLKNNLKEIIYSGVDNNDWLFEGVDQENHLIYTLTIP